MSSTFVAENPIIADQESTYTWTIYYSEMKNYAQSTTNIAGNPYSQTFHQIENNWQGLLRIREEFITYRVELLLNAVETVDIKYKLIALNSQNQVLQTKQGEITIHKQTKSEDLKCCSFLLIPCSIFQVYNFIRIKVTILEKVSVVVCGTNESKGVKRKHRGTPKINASDSLKNDFKILLENKEFSDFVIKLNDSDEISVHRTILAARSPVFAAMFKNDSLERNEGYVKITDMNKDTLMLLLNFIYTGNIALELSVEEAKNLLAAADKYHILDLKRICGKYLESNLEIANAVDNLLLSELYNVPELKNCVFEFIIDNKESFSDSTMFENVGKQFPNLMTELVMKIFADKHLVQRY